MKVLITNKVHDKLISGLQDAGYAVDYNTDINNITIRDVISGYDGIIINSKIKADKDLIDKGSRLKFIGRLGSGLEIIDVQYAAIKGIEVLNSPEGNRNAVAEHAIGMLLSLANNLVRADQEVKAMKWNREQNRGFEISGKTIGIIGFGNTGQALARKLRCWDMTIIAFDKYINALPEEFSYVCKKDIDYIQKKCDIISFHLPLTAETKYFFNKKFIQGCEKQIVIVNTSRGQVVELSALLLGLESGKIRGACLDVFENEKPSTFSSQEKEIYKRLYEFSQVITSPHIAGWTSESLEKIATILLHKILIRKSFS